MDSLDNLEVKVGYDGFSPGDSLNEKINDEIFLFVSRIFESHPMIIKSCDACDLKAFKDPIESHLLTACGQEILVINVQVFEIPDYLRMTTGVGFYVKLRVKRDCDEIFEIHQEQELLKMVR